MSNTALLVNHKLTKAADEGIAELQRQAHAEDEALRSAEQIAREIIRGMADAGARITERELIDSVRAGASSSNYVAAYVVDKLRSTGFITKNWRTGELRLAEKRK